MIGELFENALSARDVGSGTFCHGVVEPCTVGARQDVRASLGVGHASIAELPQKFVILLGSMWRASHTVTLLFARSQLGD